MQFGNFQDYCSLKFIATLIEVITVLVVSVSANHQPDGDDVYFFPNGVDYELEPESVIPCCEEENLKSCTRVQVNSNLIKMKLDSYEESNTPVTFKFPNLEELAFENGIESIPGIIGFHIMKNGTDGIFTYSTKTENVMGSISTSDGREFLLENCGPEYGYVWKEVDLDKLGQVSGMGNDEVGSDAPKWEESNSQDYQLNQWNGPDDNEVVTVSLRVYMTPAFQSSLNDPEQYVAGMISDINQGFRNSRVDAIIRLCDIEIFDIPDNIPPNEVMGNLPGGRGIEILKTADASLLLVNRVGGNFNVGGQAYFDAWKHNSTYGWVTKSVALSIHGAGHEIAHMFGTDHDRVQASKDGGFTSSYPAGYGYLMDGRRRSIMAYNSGSHGISVNYYSGPNLMTPDGYRTGTDNENNAQVLQMNRRHMANVGDESRCTAFHRDQEPRPRTTPAPTTTTESMENLRWWLWLWRRRQSRG